MYERAFQLAQDLEDDDKTLSMPTRIRARVIALERAALASGVYATIQGSKVCLQTLPRSCGSIHPTYFSQNDIVASLNALLQALRLLNRAADTLSRLAPLKKVDEPSVSADPFAMSDMRDALPASNGAVNGASPEKERKVVPDGVDQRSRLDGLEWRVATSLFETHLALSHVYAFRGSAREAEYFAHQAEELARILNVSALIGRALVRKGEILLSLGRVDDVEGLLEEAATLLEQNKEESVARDVADMHRLRGDCLLRNSQEEEAHDAYQDAEKAMEFARKGAMATLELVMKGNGPSNDPEDVFLPVLQATILKQQGKRTVSEVDISNKKPVWLLRDELGEEYTNHLERLLALPQLPQVEVSYR